ncbi:hypothetical protein CP981_06680 [Streptomyces platensis]|uniref:Uncharacterized protein n=1 Tax=Streptomyces platensis TaxID=58346 RepID=A0AAE6NGH1_STRPT|nr:hypothetical protein CP981_06680 [Streptomyces platensis]
MPISLNALHRCPQQGVAIKLAQVTPLTSMGSYEFRNLSAAAQIFLCCFGRLLGGYRAPINLCYCGLGHLGEPDGDLDVLLHRLCQRLSRIRDFWGAQDRDASCALCHAVCGQPKVL